MLVVKVHMWPLGRQDRERLMCQASFSCQGAAERTDLELGVMKDERAYTVRLYKGVRFGGPADGDPLGTVVPKRKVWREAHVLGHRPMRGSRAVRGEWDLIGGSLGAMLGSRLDPYRTFGG